MRTNSSRSALGRLTGRVRSVAVWGVVAVVAAPSAAGQGIRTVREGEQAIEVRTQVRHTTTVVLPVTETIVDVVSGDADYWDVTAAAHVAYIKPLSEDVSSNVTLVTESGRVWALLVTETADRDPDLVVRVEAPDADARRAGRLAPAFLPGETLAVELAEEAAARAELASVEAAAAGALETVRRRAAGDREAWLASYPRQLRFPYRLPAAARLPPFEIEAVWHDGQFTFVRSHAQETPAIYELRGEDRDPALVAYRVDADGLYIADHVLGAGRLRIGNEETDWWFGSDGPQSGWTWTPTGIVGGIAAAVLMMFLVGGGS